jgi:small subunit ribosomal protein S17
MTETQEQTTASNQRQRRVLTRDRRLGQDGEDHRRPGQRRYKHPRYRKYVSERIRYKAHDENNEAKIGDTVRIIVSCRPLSRDKRWMLQAVVEKAIGV